MLKLVGRTVLTAAGLVVLTACTSGPAARPPRRDPPLTPKTTQHPRTIFIPSAQTAQVIQKRLVGRGLILVHQRVDGLEVVCKSVGHDVYGVVDLPAPTWLELPTLTPEELDENLETPAAQPAQRLRVTRLLTARLGHTNRWFTHCIEATHYVDRVDLDVEPDGREVVRRLVLQPVADQTPPCRFGFHLASQIPDLCVKRNPYTCRLGASDCAAECTAGDAGSCEHAAMTHWKNPKEQLDLAERACALDSGRCCHLGLLLGVGTGAGKRIEEVTAGGCAQAQHLCCLSLATARQNRGALEGSSSAFAQMCEAGDAGGCLRSAEAAEKIGNLSLARRHAAVACQAEIPTACREWRRLSKAQ